MQGVILAGGIGERLRPFTRVIPKPMLPVGDRSILEIQIGHLRASGITEIIFAAGYKSELLHSYFGDGEKFGVKLSYSIEEEPLGTCGPISLLEDRITGDFVVMNGDILTDLDLNKVLDFHKGAGGPMTVVSKDVTFPISYGNLEIQDDCVIGLVEKPDITVEIVTGIYVMSPSILAHMTRNVKLGMDELMARLLAKKVVIRRYKMSDYWLDIGRMENYEQAQADYERYFK